MRSVIQTGLLSLLLAMTAASGQQPAAQISYLPHWLPQAQFAGFYMAEDLGIFHAHGLDVIIQRGGPTMPPLNRLLEKKADFTGLFLFQGVAAAGNGRSVVNIAQLGQRAALMLVAKKSTGIEKPSDMQGMYLGVWQGFELLPLAFFKKYDLRMHLIVAASPVNLFLREGVAVTTAMWYNEYHTLLTSGLDANGLATFNFAEHGLNLPEDGIYCLAETREKRPEVCAAFTAAVLEGWQAAFARPDQAMEAVKRRMLEAHVAYSPAHQRWMLLRMQDLMQAKGKDYPLGALARSDYELAVQILREGQAIRMAPDFSSFYRGTIDAGK